MGRVETTSADENIFSVKTTTAPLEILSATAEKYPPTQEPRWQTFPNDENQFTTEENANA